MLLKTEEVQPTSGVLVWSRDSRSILLVLDTESDHHLAKLRLPENILVGLPSVESPALSPDGTRMACDTSYGGGGNPMQSQLVVVDLDGKPVAHLGRGATGLRYATAAGQGGTEGRNRVRNSDGAGPRVPAARRVGPSGAARRSRLVHRSARRR
jgi:hypothetical protein